jgi:hypothetical protein
MSDQSPLGTVVESLTTDRDRLRAAVEAVPPPLRARRPSQDRWSVAEVLEHLSIVEGRVLMMLTPMIAAAPVAEGPRSGATAFDRAPLLDRGNRITAPEQIQPTGKVTAEDAWTSLERTRRDLLRLLGTAEDRDLTRIGRVHPVLGQLDGYQWITAVGGHEHRHAKQILEIGGELQGQVAQP